VSPKFPIFSKDRNRGDSGAERKRPRAFDARVVECSHRAPIVLKDFADDV